MKNKQKLKISVIIYTYNRIEDAKINMEIIRNLWSKSKRLEIKIVHCFNGQKLWYKKKYLENDLVRLKNSGHFQGAAELIDSGVKVVEKKYKDTDYVIFLASDTWLIKPAYLERILTRMKSENKYLASCPWGLPEYNNLRDVGIAVDFFILNYQWAKKYKMFPVDYGNFFNKYFELFSYQGQNISLEKLMLGRFIQAVFREKRINVGLRQYAYQKFLNLADRNPVHTHVDKDGYWIRKMYWPKMGLLTHHEVLPKKQILKKAKITQGKNIKELLASKSLDYFLPE